MKAKTAIVGAVCLLPHSEIKTFLLRRLGWQIGAGVRISPIILVDVDEIELRDHSFLAPASVYMGLRELRLGEHARIGKWNWISASQPLQMAGGKGHLLLGPHSAITTRHYFDCSGGVEIGHHTTIAGVRSTFITHGIRWQSSRQSFKGIAVGNYCIVSSNVAIAPGSNIPDNSVLGMAVAYSGKHEVGGLFLTERATVVKERLVGKYFQRSRGYIDSIESSDQA